MEPWPQDSESGTRGLRVASLIAASTASNGSGAWPMPAVIAQRAPASSMTVREGTKATERAGERNAKDAKSTGTGPSPGAGAATVSHAARTCAIASALADSRVSARPRPTICRRAPSHAAPPEAGSS